MPRLQPSAALLKTTKTFYDNGLITMPLKGKVPMVKNWTNLELPDAFDPNYYTTSSAGWVIREPYIVIDVDVRAKINGMVGLQRLTDDLGFDFMSNAGITVRTPTGGLHLYYKIFQSDVSYKKNLAAYEGLDFLRDGHQVLIPNSETDSGTYKLDGAPNRFSNIVEIPEGLHLLLEQKEAESCAGTGYFTDHKMDKILLTGYVNQFGVIGEGERNKALYKMACRGYDLGLSPEVVLGIVADADCFVPPLSTKEMATTLVSALSTRQNEIGSHAVEEALKALGPIDTGCSPGQGLNDVLPQEQADAQFAEVCPWHDKLHKTKHGTVSAQNFCVRNCAIFLKNMKEFKGKLGYNEWSRETVWLEPCSWHAFDKADCMPNGIAVTDDDLLSIKTLFNDMEFDPLVNQIYQAARTVGFERSFHPVKKWFSELPKWDGVERVRGLFSKYCNAADTAFNREVGEVLMCAIVKRIYEPGCKYDHMVVLVGPEEQGKSTAIKALSVFNSWFTDSLGDINKTGDAILQIKGKLIIEDSELNAFMSRSTTVASVKAFISREVDRARLAYAKLTEDVPRQCVFMGTTNEHQFLNSVTGNRRIWPVEVYDIDVPTLTNDLPQLYAEALVVYKKRYAGLKNGLVLQSAEAMEQAKKAQTSRIEVDELERVIQEWLNKGVRDGFQLSDVWDGLGRDIIHLSIKEQKRLERALLKLQYKRSDNGFVKIGGKK